MTSPELTQRPRSRADGPPALRVLLLAEACNPAWPGAPLVGYNFARALARHERLDVTLATQVRNERDLDGDILTQTARVEYIDTEWIAGGMYRTAKRLRGDHALASSIATALSAPSYYAFEREVLRRFEPELHGTGGFDLVHRITPSSPVIPSSLVSKIDRPMVIGPLDHGLPMPEEFSELRDGDRAWLQRLRWMHRLLPHTRRTYSDLSGLIAGSLWTASNVPRSFRGEQLLLPEKGIEPDVFPIADGWSPPRGRFRFVSVGHLTPAKGFDMVIEAIAGSPRLRETGLTIVGDGPERAALEAAVRDYGLQRRVRLRGWLPPREVAAELGTSQAFVSASVKRLGGGAVLEGMSAGLPSVVVDHGGPAELVDDDCGIRVPMARRSDVVAGLRAAMERLVDDHQLCERLGRSAVEAVRAHHTWDAKAERIVNFYDDVLEGNGAPSVRRIGTRTASRV